jgi:DNA-directed RNA polymerase specialized sigma24 family protein
MDFSDAVSHVFAWFDGKLAKNRRFINSRRYPTFGAFKAYLRQSLWNAAILAQRKRRRREEIETPSIDPNALAKMDSQMEIDILLDLVNDLPEPHKTVLERIFFDEGDPNNIAGALDMSIDDLYRYYEEAIDMLEQQGAVRRI